MVSSFIRNEKLREAFSFHTLLVGGNPMTASAIYALIHKLEKDGGVWFAKGGTNALGPRHGHPFRAARRRVAAGRSGRTHRDGRRPSDRRHHASGLQFEADAVASNADLMHSYRDLLAGP